MANTLLTIGGITREAIRLFVNSNAFIGNIPKQYDDQFARTGAKIGQQLRIRLPNDYVVSDGPALSVQDTNEQQTTITVATQRHVDTSFNSQDLTMSLDDYSEIILAPKINNLAGNVAATIMSGVTVAQGPFQGTVVNGVEGGICNLVQNLDNSGNIISPTLETWTSAGAVLDDNSAAFVGRKAILTPFTMARTVSNFSGLLNPATDISRQYRNSRMYDALNFEWFSDQTAIIHTSGSFSAGTVSGGSQTGTTLTTNAITGTLNKGDIITLGGVNAVNRVTKVSTGNLRQFVVTANVASGATSIPIYPAIVPANNGQAVQYQTVDLSPLNGATILLVTPASGQYRKNFVFAKDCVTMVTADLEMPPDVKVAREEMDGISMRAVRQYVIGTDQTADRLDVLFGWLFIRPEWGVTVCDKV
jgi:P22 coat protein - gene protein 5